MDTMKKFLFLILMICCACDSLQNHVEDHMFSRSHTGMLNKQAVKGMI